MNSSTVNIKAIPVIFGPTASGKTRIAEILAQISNGEIISADSRQIYRKLDIGTAKPVNSSIRYHLTDIIEPEEQFDAARFIELAIEVCNEILSREKLPIIAGGTGLYIRALTVGIFSGDFKNIGIRNELKKKHESGENLYIELQKLDPAAAERIDPRNYVRIERALEVSIVSGKPISYWWEHATKAPSDFRFAKYCLEINREKLYRQIEERTFKMLDSGWVNEVEELLNKGVSPESPGLSSIGYRTIVKFILGEITYEDMSMQIIRETKRYAKRQITWFRKEPNTIQICIDDMQPDEIAEKIFFLWKTTRQE